MTTKQKLHMLTVAERITPTKMKTSTTFTGLHPFSSGQAAFNFARKHNADRVTVAVTHHTGNGTRRAVAMLIVRLTDGSYEGRTGYAMGPDLPEVTQ